MTMPLDNNPELIDNLPLIEMTKNFLSRPEYKFSFNPYDNGSEAVRLGFRSINSREKLAYIVTAEESALELGSPRHTSIGTMMWTAQKNILSEGVWISGRSFDEIGEPMANLLLSVMVEVPSDYDPGNSRFRSILNLSNRIPGYMSRSVPGKLWIRISRDLMNKNFSPLSLGQSLIYAFHDAFPGIGNVEIIVAAGERGLTEAFEPVHNLERIYSGKNRKLSLEASGVIGCEDLTCGSCEEKPSCDTIRDIMVIKKSKENRV